MVKDVLRNCGISLILLLVAAKSSSAFVPNTEVGDVVIRELDALQFVPYLPIYLGHAGIFDQWYGGDVTNPSNFMVYDMG